MEITLSRKTVLATGIAVVVVIALLAGLLLRSAVGGPRSVVHAPEAQPLLAETVRIAEGIGTGDLYLHPESYPLSDELEKALKERLAREPNPKFLPYRGAVGTPVIALSTQDFVDTVYHLSFAQSGGVILTQVQLRFQKVNGQWTVVKMDTYARGALP